MTVQRVDLPVLGYRSEPLRHVYLQHPVPVTALGLLLPGLSYGLSRPGLLYASRTLTDLGFDTFGLDTSYHTPEFQALPDDMTRPWLTQDVEAAFQAAWQARSYTRLCLVAKSLGTLSLHFLLASGQVPEDAQLVWLTPVLNRPEVLEQILQRPSQSLVVIGTEDPHFQEERITHLLAAGVEVLVLTHADHALDVPGDTVASLAHLHRIMQRLRAFVTQG
ncbi:hypothetical protein [Deinococcus sp. QL22]|uniref:hypothetical protein n=1 Tax=Deinococcus sp. QL22 TaxID=2939437 RepID=UPI0020180668|nr:hypothetical protein [Deinococcus sp. QL22]UQN10586.1 hypothetical protein M1R55_30780 [Deinococcus sp. QL22]